MPEGPEVTIIAKGLNKLLKDKIIISFEINDKSRYYKKSPIGYNEFIKRNSDGDNKLNIGIKEINNKGKFIYWIFNDNTILFQTLGMSGGWYKHNANHSSNHSGVVVTYLDKEKDKDKDKDKEKDKEKDEVNKLYFSDQRRFGTLKFYEPSNSKKELNKKLKTLGPDILNDELFNKDDFLKIMRKPSLKNKNITRIITNQKIISGVGNYLKAEALYHAKINPHKLVNQLSDKEIINLFSSIKYKIIGSYKTGGTSIRNYSDIDDIKGKYKFELEVYGRKKDNYNNDIITEKIAKDTQNTYWCPEIQKM
jgi:DNA-formamidopyrimidine glycosylase